MRNSQSEVCVCVSACVSKIKRTDTRLDVKQRYEFTHRHARNVQTDTVDTDTVTDTFNGYKDVRSDTYLVLLLLLLLSQVVGLLLLLLLCRHGRSDSGR